MQEIPSLAIISTLITVVIGGLFKMMRDYFTSIRDQLQAIYVKLETISMRQEKNNTDIEEIRSTVSGCWKDRGGESKVSDYLSREVSIKLNQLIDSHAALTKSVKGYRTERSFPHLTEKDIEVKPPKQSDR